MHAPAAGGLRRARPGRHHPTAEDVFQAVRSTIPRISLATVYKALEALVAIGAAHPADAGEGTGSARYDARRDPHYHFRCLRTGHGPRPAHPVRPRADRQARPPARRLPWPPGLPGHRIPPRAGRVSRTTGASPGRAARDRGMTAPTPDASVPWSTPTPTSTTTGFAADLDGRARPGAGRGRRADRRHRHDGADSARGAATIARRHRGIFAAVGIHPNDAAEAGPSRLGTRSSTCVASPGSSRSARPGLDRYWDRTPFADAAGMVRPPPGAGTPARPAGRDPLPRLRRAT